MEKNLERKSDYIIKIFLIIDFIYELIKNSFCFWIFFIKGVGILSLKSSIRALMYVSVDILKKNRKKSYSNFKSNYVNSDKDKFHSLFLFFFFLYTLTMSFFPFTEQLQGSILFVLQYLTLFISITALITLSAFQVYKIVYPGIEWKMSMIVYSLGKSLIWTAILIPVIFILFFLSIKNLIFFLALMPGIYGALCGYVFERTSDRTVKKYEE